MEESPDEPVGARRGLEERRRELAVRFPVKLGAGTLDFVQLLYAARAWCLATAAL